MSRWRRAESLLKEALPARFVVGADGLKSSVRHSAVLDGVYVRNSAMDFRRHYRLAPWSEYAELYSGSTGQFFMTARNTGEVCVVFISRDSKLRLDAALADFPYLRDRLHGAKHGSHEMGSMSISRSLKRIYKDGVALLGDASGSVDAVTGEGLCLTFKRRMR